MGVGVMNVANHLRRTRLTSYLRLEKLTGSDLIWVSEL